MRAFDIIAKKRDKKELSKEEIEFFIVYLIQSLIGPSSSTTSIFNIIHPPLFR